MEKIFPSENTITACRQVPTDEPHQIIGKALQIQTNATGTIVQTPLDTLGNNTSWHFRLLVAAWAGFSQLTPNPAVVNWT
jgi:hypothetical protein